MAERHEDMAIPKGVEPSDRFVTILDPATGTGTFLVETIEIIHRTLVEKWKHEGYGEKKTLDLWNDYVPKHLLPRLHGYELLMAPYAIAHLKIGLKLHETGYRFENDERARIYLTNALEPAHDFSGQFEFAIPALAHEAEAVNEVKRRQRFTVVIGNPPYANFGQLNRIPFILDLLEDYKRGLDEKKLNLDDDYLKFLRLGQYIVERSGSGILGMITNSSFLDGLIHRKLRESLLKQFSDGYILNLHGNSRRGDTAPDGSPDKNVFDIQQGVVISMWATCGACGIHLVKYSELWGKRENKYDFLFAHTLLSTRWSKLKPQSEQFFFVSQNVSMRDEYEAGVPLGDVFTVVGSGLNTDRDELCIDFNRTLLSERMQRVFSGNIDADFVQTYNFRASSSYDPAALAKRQSFDPKALRVCTYRPFDSRHIYYKVGFTSRPVFEAQGHMLHPNLGLLVCRQSKEPFAVLATRNISTHKIVAVYDRTSLAPLWLYQDERYGQQAMDGLPGPWPSLAEPFLKNLAARLQLRRGEHGLPDGLTAEDVFHYVYAAFHSPAYRIRYSEFLKTDFPRLPLTSSLKLFRELAQLGSDLVALHLIEAPMQQALSARYDDNAKVWRYEATRGQSLPVLLSFSGHKKPIVGQVGWSNDTVWIDAVKPKKGAADTEVTGSIGFRGVPEEVWNFYIGGYQVCEKWLKDRKGQDPHF